MSEVHLGKTGEREKPVGDINHYLHCKTFNKKPGKEGSLTIVNPTKWSTISTFGQNTVCLQKQCKAVWSVPVKRLTLHSHMGSYTAIKKQLQRP